MEYDRLLSRYAYAEARVERSADSSAMVKDEEVRRIAGTSRCVSVRVLEKGSWGFASSTSGESLDSLLAKAHRLACLGKGNAKPAMLPSGRKSVRDRAERMDGETQAKILLEASGDMRAHGIASRSVSCSDSEVRKEFYNSNGAEIIQEYSYTYLSCAAVARSGETIQRGSERQSSRHGFARMKVFETAGKAREKALRLLKAGTPPRGRFTVVLDPEMTGVFSHEAVGHACEADSVIDRESILRDKLGKRIGNSLVTIVDDPGADDFGRYAYDDEGARAKAVKLVERGVLRGYLNSLETAHSLGMAPNGHARADGCAAVPIVRMSNTYFQRGKSSVDEVFEVKEGIYLRGMKGGSVDIFSGGFMFKAEEAYEIRNGEKGRVMRDTTISGNILQTMLDVECVGNDFGTSPGVCGKFGQEAPVSDGGPHIRVKNVAIG